MRKLKVVDDDVKQRSFHHLIRKSKSTHHQSSLWQWCIRRRINNLAVMKSSQELPPARIRDSRDSDIYRKSFCDLIRKWRSAHHQSSLWQWCMRRGLVMVTCLWQPSWELPSVIPHWSLCGTEMGYWLEPWFQSPLTEWPIAIRTHMFESLERQQ